jgi:hypothetical protein
MTVLTRPSRWRSFLESFFIDAPILAGMGLLAYGAWLTFPPAGFIVGGALLIAVGALGARR